MIHGNIKDNVLYYPVTFYWLSQTNNIIDNNKDNNDNNINNNTNNNPRSDRNWINVYWIWSKWPTNNLHLTLYLYSQSLVYTILHSRFYTHCTTLVQRFLVFLSLLTVFVTSSSRIGMLVCSRSNLSISLTTSGILRSRDLPCSVPLSYGTF